MFDFKRNKYVFLLIILVALLQCSLDNSAPKGQGSGLKLIAEYNLDVSEPSGLSLSGDKSELWTVSDNTNNVYKISLDGRTIDQLRYQGNDLEGIVYDGQDSTLWLAEEQLRQLVQIDLSGKELKRKSINLPGSGNSGFEGIALNPGHAFVILNEKDPRLWAQLNSDFSVNIEIEINSVDDISGICFDPLKKMYWVVSDKSQLLFLWDPDHGLIESFDLDFEKAEGVAYNPDLDRIYIVSDKTEKLYIFELTKN